MASGAKCFVLNRKTDFLNSSVMNNFKFNEDSMVSFGMGAQSSVYIAGPFDSMESETIWHRMRMDLEQSPGMIFKLRVYASDTSEIRIPIPGKDGLSLVDINEHIFDKNINISRKIDVFDYIGAKVFNNSFDVLLYGLKGRYFWFCLEVVNNEMGKIRVNSIKIEFPQISFSQYLPEVYTEKQPPDSFFQRFLGIFQSIYTDLEDKIDYTPIKFDVDSTSRDFLNRIADWLSIKDISLWGEEKLRKLIKEAVKIYKMKGTKQAVAKIVNEYIGIEPIIVEQFDVRYNMYYDKNKHVIENLFGDNGYVFTVMLPENYIPDSEKYVELLRIINSVKPLDSICNLVSLNNQTYLDHHCYMGINSFITTNENLVLNKKQKEVNNLVITDSKI